MMKPLSASISHGLRNIFRFGRAACSITIVVVSATGNLGCRERISLASPAPSMVPGITISLKTRSILAGLKQFQCGFG